MKNKKGIAFEWIYGLIFLVFLGVLFVMFNYVIEEHISFPEIILEEVKESFGLGITVVTTTQDQEKGLTLLKLLGFPFKKNNKENK